MGRHSLLVQSAISTVARNAAANKQIMADAQTARAAYSKRYMPCRTWEQIYFFVGWCRLIVITDSKFLIYSS
jgi:hypothetical protein